MPRLALSNYESHYQQDGAGPDVVLVHGFTSNLAMWLFSGIVASLAERFRVTAYDLRGHGASSAPPTGYSSDVLADDLAELHERLGLKPAWLVGHSLGGVVAMHAALVHPDRVSGVVLSDTYFPGLAHLEPGMPHADVWVHLAEHMQAAGRDIGPTVDFRRLLSVVADLDDAARDTLRERLGPPATRWLAQLRPLAATSAAEEAFAPAGLTSDALGRVTQPVYALYDEHTPFTATYDWLLAHLPNCRGDRVPGAAHLALLESPEEFTRLVRDYLIEMTRQCDKT